MAILIPPHPPFILSHLLRDFASSLLLQITIPIWLPQHLSSNFLSTHFLKECLLSSGIFLAASLVSESYPQTGFVWFCIACLGLWVDKCDLVISICAFWRLGLEWDLVAKYTRYFVKPRLIWKSSMLEMNSLKYCMICILH
jgi:hypothetical protein